MNMKRMRGRNHRGTSPGPGSSGGTPIRHHTGTIPLNRNHVFDSSGPDLRVRGTAQQLFEKYLQLGRDANSSSDRVMAESYFQHAEHYFRIINAMNQAAQGQTAHTSPPQQSGAAYNGPHQNRRQYVEQPDADDGDRAGEQPVEARDIPIGAGPDA
jgi:hypothetical protein